MVIRWKSSALVLCLCLLAERAAAQEPPRVLVDLKYEVDPALQGCPSAGEFRSIVAQQLGYDPYSLDSTLDVRVRVRATEKGTEGTIEWLAGIANKLGERRFTSRSDDCLEMMATVGFVVAVQIQLMATEKAAETGVRVTKPKPAEEQVLTHAQTTLTTKSFEVRPTSSPDPTRWSATVGIGTAIGYGLGPNPVVQGRLFLALQSGWFGLEGGAEASLPSTKREAYGGGFRHDLQLGTLGLCGWYTSIAACGLGKIGRVHVQGLGVDKPNSSDGLAAQLGPRFAYSLQLGNHFVLLEHIEALYLLTPWTVELNRVVVWSMPRFSVSAGIELAVRF